MLSDILISANSMFVGANLMLIQYGDSPVLSTSAAMVGCSAIMVIITVNRITGS